MKNNAVLYILMRSDMDSLNPGKMAAQACHAANYMAVIADASNPKLYRDWAEQAKDQYFGTTIVLDIGTIEKAKEIINKAKEIVSDDVIDKSFVSGIVLDSSYPIRDGSVTHTLPVETCGFLLCYRGTEVSGLLSSFPLYA